MKSRNAVMAGLVVVVLGCGVALTRPLPDPRLNHWGAKDMNPASALQSADPACESTTLVSTGGAFPEDPHMLALRWTGFSNFELVYNGLIILPDACFDRGSVFPPLGFKAADVKKADLLLLGHGHVDHMSDAASFNTLWRATEPLFQAMKDENPKLITCRRVIASRFVLIRNTICSGGANSLTAACCLIIPRI